MILNTLQLNGNFPLIELIILLDRAIHGGTKRAHRTPHAQGSDTDMPCRKATNLTDQRDAQLLEIAQRQFRIETLETRNWDRLDFHDVAVWAIRAALEEAFDAGRRAGPTNTQAQS